MCSVSSGQTGWRRKSRGGRVLKNPRLELLQCRRKSRRTGFPAEPIHHRPRQKIAPFILRMPGVSLQPLPFDAVDRRQRIQLPPEVLVLHRHLVPGFPPVSFPTLDPSRDPLPEIVRIRVQRHPTGPLEQPECSDGRRQFHSVVGGRQRPAGVLAPSITTLQHARPSPHPRVALASPIRMNNHLRPIRRIGIHRRHGTTSVPTPSSVKISNSTECGTRPSTN